MPAASFHCLPGLNYAPVSSLMASENIALRIVVMMVIASYW
jgi:hypothetical protein